MTALLDIRTIRDFIAYPFRWIFSDDSETLEIHERSGRKPLIMRWKRGDDGKLEGHWDTE